MCRFLTWNALEIGGERSEGRMKYPKTPELNKLQSVKAKSQVIGEFLDIYLREKGIVLCTFREAGNNGAEHYRWKDGVIKAKLDGAKVGSRKPNGSDYFNGDAAINPEREDWPDEYLPITKSIEKLLAEYFEIDLNKVESERRKILESLRS